jgi:replicative DNA helicase
MARLIADVAKSYLGIVGERQKRGGVETIGIPTGFHRVDELTGGLQPDTLTIIGARPGVGKTSLALNIAQNVAKANNRVLFYSLEMTAERMVNRMLSSMTMIPGGKIVRGMLSPEEFRRVKQAAEELRQYPIAMADTTFTSEGLADDAEKWAERAAAAPGPPLGLVVVDYLSLLRDAAKVNENERVARISSNLRALARPDYLNIPIIALVQLNRSVEGRENKIPNMSDIRDSGAVEQDAENVWFPFRPYYYEQMNGSPPLEEERDARIIIAKNREGPTGSTPVTFYPAKTTWSQPKPEPVEPHPVKGSLTERVQKGRKD